MLSSTTGVQQCDPLGPLLFVMVLQVLLKQVREANPLVTLAFLDDVSLVADSLNQMEHMLMITRREGPKLGLHLSPTKSVLWSPFDVTVSVNRFTPDICAISFDKGVELLGGCVAIDSSFMSTTAEKRVVKLNTAIDVMLQIGDPQLCLLLLRSCIGQPKLNYCWRVMPAPVLYGIAARCDTIIIKTLNAILAWEGEYIDEFTFDLATLSVALSGSGVDRPSHVLEYAHLAARIDTHNFRSRQFGQYARNENLLDICAYGHSPGHPSMK